MSTPDKRPRVVVLSLNYHPTKRVQSYMTDLVNAGVDVDLLVAESASTQDVELDPRVNVRRVLDAEENLPVRRVERALVFTLPGKVFGKARSITANSAALRPVDPVAVLAKRAQGKLSRGVHWRLFWPAFRIVRPWVLARRGRTAAQAFDLATADRIVAADHPAIPLAWRLARRYPQVRATTALDRKPYLAPKPN
jgi:hypothetical protein